MITRNISQGLIRSAKQLPVVAILGPRQSGKTTIAKYTFSNHKYISLEDLDVRAAALEDPRRFLKNYSQSNNHGIILDEIQNAPSLLSYIQTLVDEKPQSGYFILTGSQNFLVNQAITQTLAGRVAILTLLPLSINELKSNNLLPNTLEELIFKGCYPRIYSQNVDPDIFYPSYINTYVERDIRQITNIGDLTIFKKFLGLCAGRIGQLLNIASLANDCGINIAKAKQWLSLLQASYIIFLLQPHYKNFSKRLVKTPKLYFYDTGIACSLLEIDNFQQLVNHYLRGGLTENLIISDFYKYYYNSLKHPNIYFWRDNHGHEVDCLIEKSNILFPIEIKSGHTVNSDFFKGLKYWYSLTNTESNGFLVYGGDQHYDRKFGSVISWTSTYKIIKNILS